MDISSAYKLIKNSIVAFVPKYVPLYDEKEKPPLFPPILGTGFVVREDGVLATNAHVVRMFKRLPVPPDVPKDEWPVRGIMLKLLEQKGMAEVPLELLGVAMIKSFTTGPAYYGPKEGPDLAFVHVKMRGLPAVAIDNRSVIDEGTEIATAGFPMGLDALMAPGWIHQVTPTLQRGIVSAVLPFPCPTPHAYSINIMVQGGASGSPVFLSDTGAVVGVLYAGLNDLGQTLKNKDIYKVPTNISYVVPSHYLRHSLDEISRSGQFTMPADAVTLDDFLKRPPSRDLLKEGRGWIRKEVDPKAEAARVSEVTRLEPKQ